eukprot:TRINITY_DN4050_c0_g2_i2.p1 TRINITY_DN4050_c0_g2~~TRINITY_DN4050_c0_g2_i2.p1  ORF type:complete len:466 (+),score=100.41 TRINITY_DN4050_c0_g2_i2:43-1440(+)
MLRTRLRSPSLERIRRFAATAHPPRTPAAPQKQPLRAAEHMNALKMSSEPGRDLGSDIQHWKTLEGQTKGPNEQQRIELQREGRGNRRAIVIAGMAAVMGLGFASYYGVNLFRAPLDEEMARRAKAYHDEQKANRLSMQKAKQETPVVTTAPAETTEQAPIASASTPVAAVLPAASEDELNSDDPRMPICSQLLESGESTTPMVTTPVPIAPAPITAPPSEDELYATDASLPISSQPLRKTPFMRHYIAATQAFSAPTYHASLLIIPDTPDMMSSDEFDSDLPPSSSAQIIDLSSPSSVHAELSTDSSALAPSVDHDSAFTSAVAAPSQLRDEEVVSAEQAPLPVVSAPVVLQEEAPLPVVSAPAVLQEEAPLPVVSAPALLQEQAPFPVVSAPASLQEEAPLPVVSAPALLQEQAPFPVVSAPASLQEETAPAQTVASKTPLAVGLTAFGAFYAFALASALKSS